MIDTLITILLVLAILVVLVVIHELGHFVTARLAKVRVHEFGIGFPPRARVLGHDGETVYTLNWLPIGGFVRLEGEEGESKDPRAFVRQPLLTRIVILLSGVLMNFLLAWLIFSVIAAVADPTATAKLGYVEPGSPAAQVGLVGASDEPEGEPVRTGDEILAVDGIRFAFFDNLNPVEYVVQRPGETVTLTVRRADGGIEQIPVQLRPREQLSPERGPLGIRVRTIGFGQDLQREPLDAAAVGWRRTVDASLLILTTLRDLFGELDDPQVSGPIGIVSTVGTVRTQLPPNFLFYLVALLSANLAVVNALPFPPLDGGRVAIGLLRSIFGRRISIQAERATYLVGFVLLMAFLVWISYFDIRRLPGN